MSTSQASPTKSASSSCGLFGLFAAETDRDVAYGWLLRRSPQPPGARPRPPLFRARLCPLGVAKERRSAIAHGGAAVASLRDHARATARRGRRARATRGAAAV